jgi:hypothetical protein
MMITAWERVYSKREADGKYLKFLLTTQVSHQFNVAFVVLRSLDVPYSALHVWTEQWSVTSQI